VELVYGVNMRFMQAGGMAGLLLGLLWQYVADRRK